MQIIEYIKEIATVLGAFLAIGAFVWAIIKWILSQNNDSKEIKSLKELHTKDMKESERNRSIDMQRLNNELCVINYALLAALDGLKQLHCNGEVTKAHDMLEKHINQKAHNQK